MLKKLSRLIGIISSVLNMLPWLFLTYQSIYITCLAKITEPYVPVYLVFPAFLLISALGLLGSLLVRKKPKAGTILMLVSGVILLLRLVRIWWLVITPLLLIAAGALAYISYKITPAGNENQNLDSSG